MVPGSIRDFLPRCLQTTTTRALQLTTPVRKHTHTVGSQFRQVCSQSQMLQINWLVCDAGVN